MNTMNLQDKLKYDLEAGEIDIYEALTVISGYLEDTDVPESLYRLKNLIVSEIYRNYR
jgi:hypothetical protein